MTFLWFGFLCVPKTKKADAVCFFYRAGRIKEGFPGGERKGVARREQSLLSPSTELERLGATSGSATAGRKVSGLRPDAEGYLSLRQGLPQVGAVPCLAATAW